MEVGLNWTTQGGFTSAYTLMKFAWEWFQLGSLPRGTPYVSQFPRTRNLLSSLKMAEQKSKASHTSTLRLLMVHWSK